MGLEAKSGRVITPELLSNYVALHNPDVVHQSPHDQGPP